LGNEAGGETVEAIGVVYLLVRVRAIVEWHQRDWCCGRQPIYLPGLLVVLVLERRIEEFVRQHKVAHAAFCGCH
jgi:hypothetical protein